MKWYIKLLRWIWEFPQCLLGVILTLFYKVKYREDYKGIKIYSGSFPGGISCGLYILMSDYSYKNPRTYTIQHEYGHTRQSLIFGPLYLIVVGLPSIIWAAIHDKNTKRSYYSIYPENWADKLGGVPKR